MAGTGRSIRRTSIRGTGVPALTAAGVTLAAAAGLGWAAPARASGDYGCDTRLTLIHRDLDGCNNMAFLTPGNDTRTNLLLLRGRTLTAGAPAEVGYPQPSFAGTFSWGDVARWLGGVPQVGTVTFAVDQGSRCRSDADGAAAFVAALAADRRVTPADRTRLTEARRSLRPTCDGGGDTGPVGAARRSAGRASSRPI